MDITKMDIEEWHKQFTCVPNHIAPYDSSWQDEDGIGALFETYGEELDYVQNQDERYVWTLVDSDLGTSLLSGYYTVNRIGYLITTEMWESNYEVSVSIDEEN